MEEATERYIELFSKIGVDYVFCSPGNEFIPILEYLVKHSSQCRKLYYVNSRHKGLSLTLAKGTLWQLVSLN